MRRKLLRTTWLRTINIFVKKINLTNKKYILHDFNHPHHHNLHSAPVSLIRAFSQVSAHIPSVWPQMLGPRPLSGPASPHISVSPHQEPDTELIPDNQPHTRPRSVSAFRSNGNWFNQIQISKGWDWFNTPRSVAKCRFLWSSSEVEEITRNI